MVLRGECGRGRVFVEERVRLDDGFSDQLADDVVDLAQILALGSKEADELRDEVVTKIYRLASRVLSHPAQDPPSTSNPYVGGVS